MIELPPDQYDVARALFAEYVHGRGSIGSVFEGRQPAKLLVDSTSNPAVALLLRPPRHVFLAGDPSCEAVWHYMADLSPRKLFARDQLILSMPNDSWRFPIKSVLSEGLTEESRVCFRFTSGEDIAPIQVMTASEHQRKGYATIVARALIEEATQREITPSWECDTHNEASIALAEKLGFERQSEYSRFWCAP